MKKRKILVLTAALLTAGALVYAGKRCRDEKRDAKLAAIVEEIREFFASFGDIATVYIDQSASSKVETKGGVVMEDGRVYYFDYLAGEIFYQEERV